MARGDHGVAVVKASLFIVVVAAHAAGVSKPVMRSEALRDPTPDVEVHTHRHQTVSTDASELVVQNGWAKALLPNGNDSNHTREHEIDAASLLESRNAIDTVATLLNVKVDQDKAKMAPLIPYAAMSVSMSSLFGDGWKSRALTSKPNPSWPGTCTHTSNGGTQWWKASLSATYSVTKVAIVNRVDCCAHRLHGVQIYAGSHLCGTVASTAAGGTATVQCGGAKTSEIKVQITSGDYLTICGFKAYGTVPTSAPTFAPTPAPTSEPTFAPLSEEENASCVGGIAKYDKDPSDLEVTLEEAEAGGLTKEEFDGMDVNTDGVVTAEDCAEAVATNSTGGGWEKFLAMEAGAYRSAQVSAISMLVLVLFSLRM